MAKTSNHGIIRGDYGRTETGLPKLSALAIDKGLGKIKGAKDDHILKGKEAYLLGGDLGWNLSSDNAFIFHGPAAFGITQNYNRSDTGLGGSSTMSYSGDMLKVANTLKIDPSAYTNYSPYLQTYAGSQYGASSLNASTTQKLIKQNKARWVEDPVSGKQLLAAVDPKTGQVKTTVNQNKLYSLIEDATANIYTVGGYVNNKNENSAIPADPSKKNNHAFVTFSKGDDGVLTPISEPTYYKADRVIEEEGFFEGLINGLVGIASSEAGQLILAAVTMGNSFGVDKLIPQVAAKLGVNTIVAAGIVNAGANAALSLFTGGDIGKAAIYGAITGAAGAGATPIAKTMIGADNLTKLAKFAGISEKAAANYLVNSFAGASATKILNSDSNFVDTFRNNLLASYGGDKASSYVKNFINELGGKDFSLAGNLAGNTARALVTAGVTDPANAMQVLSNSWQGILVQSIGMTKAEEKAFKTYQKTAEEIQARDKTVLALNNGEIKITGKDVNGDYILDNGMTLDKNGKFYQGGKQLYADAAGYNQNSIFTADNKGKDIKIADTAGGKLTSDEAKALFRRDYGIDISDDDADLFAGKTVKNITDADVSRLTKNALGAEYKKITGEDLTDEEANKYIALGGNALDNMRYQLVGKGEIDQILDDVYKDPSLKIDVAQALPVTAEQALQLSRTAESIAARDLLARAANDPSFARTLTSDAAIESFRNKGMSALADTLSRFATGVGALVTPGNAFQQTNEDAIMAEKLKNYLKPITTEDYAAKGLPPVVVTGTKGVESIGPDGELLQDGKSTGLYIDKAGTLYDDEGNPAIENYWPTNKVPNTVPWIPGPKFPLKDPSVKPDIKPTITPTVIPTPTVTPSPTATPTPTVKPTVVPTVLPTVSPTVVPTTEPIVEPTVVPTAVPTVAPTPTVEPTTEPTQKPTVVPTTLPTAVPTVAPTTLPTAEPTVEPTTSPTTLPTVQPTVVPTVAPTTLPTTVPTAAPTTQVTTVPTAAPTTDVATAPTAVPTTAVTTAPTTAVTAAPTTVITPIPTTTVTTVPTAVVTTIPTTEVTVKPTITPTPTPTVVVTPTPSPTPSPTPTVVVLLRHHQRQQLRLRVQMAKTEKMVRMEVEVCRDLRVLRQ